MKDVGRMIKEKEMEYITMQTIIGMKDNGKKVEEKEMEYFILQMGLLFFTNYIYFIKLI